MTKPYILILKGSPREKGQQLDAGGTGRGRRSPGRR